MIELDDNLKKLLDLLIKWNKVYNLTSMTDYNEMVVNHILDSLSIAPYIEESVILDVGTGPGFPGLPLALHFPDKQFHLLDSNGKKIRFIRQAVTELQIKNVTLHQARIERFESELCFDYIVSRAFSSLKDMIKQTAHLNLGQGGYLAMKGQYPEEELADIADLAKVIGVYPLQVPGMGKQRHLVHLSRLSV